MTVKETFVNDMKSRLKTREKEIADLKFKAESAGAGSRIDIEEKIAELELKQEYTRKTLTELRTANEDRWERLQHNVESAWRDLDEAYREALISFA